MVAVGNSYVYSQAITEFTIWYHVIHSRIHWRIALYIPVQWIGWIRCQSVGVVLNYCLRRWIGVWSSKSWFVLQWRRDEKREREEGKINWRDKLKRKEFGWKYKKSCFNWLLDKFFESSWFKDKTRFSLLFQLNLFSLTLNLCQTWLKQTTSANDYYRTSETWTSNFSALIPSRILQVARYPFFLTSSFLSSPLPLSFHSCCFSFTLLYQCYQV